MGRLKNICECLAHIFLPVFTIGSTVDTCNGDRKSDGGVSSLVIGVNVFTVVFVLLLVSFTKQCITGDEHAGIIRGIFTTLFGVSVILLIAVLCDIKKKISNNTKRPLTFSKKRKVLNFFMCVLWLFGCSNDTKRRRPLTFSKK